MGEAGRTRDSLAHWEKHEERDLDEVGATPGDLLLIYQGIRLLLWFQGTAFFSFLFVRCA